jgi:hypothetical protein
MIIRRLILICLIISSINTAYGQRLSDVNAVGWYNAFGTFHISKRISLWLEYQWRREDIITSWQQSLARTGVQYHFKNDVSVLAGYGYIITYPYGDYPAGPYPIPEHRIFEQVIWNGAIGRLGLNHRLRLEQRFLGKVDQKAAAYAVNDYTYLNRVRYQLKGSIPLNHKSMQDKTWYLAPFDELFIGFGKNVNQNIFDQNRMGLLAGYKFSNMLRIEAGYFNQIVQQPALVKGNEVIQYNHGLMLNAFITR